MGEEGYTFWFYKLYTAQCLICYLFRLIRIILMMRRSRMGTRKMKRKWS